MTSTKLTGSGLAKRYTTRDGREVVALDSVDVSVRQGEFVSIVGPSGCGKSTLLFILAGLHDPTEGTVELDGERLRGTDPRCGVVFQSDATFPWLTVQRNVEFGPRERGVDRAARRRLAKRYIGLVGLDGAESLLPGELSGGMRKRVDIARALANEPEVLLMDEPFGALDAMTKERLQDELRDLWRREERTVVFVTHDLEEAIYLSTRVLVMGRNPNTIRADIPVELPEELDVMLRTTPKFQSQRRRLWELLHEEVAA